MEARPKTLEEAADIVYNILNQGDSRYNSPEDELWLADFIMHKAIILEEREIPKVDYKEKSGNFNPKLEIQGSQKLMAKKLLELEGYNNEEIQFEVAFRNSRPDVFAENSKKRVVVECCSCRINKIIDFLSEIEEIWILTHGYEPWEELAKKNKSWKMQWFVFRKGENWEKISSIYNKHLREELKKVKSPGEGIC